MKNRICASRLIPICATAPMSGGSVTVYGPEDSGNGALDYDSTFVISGGTLLAGGASGMAQTPSDTSTVYTISIGVSDTTSAVTVKDASGNVITTYTSDKTYQNLVVSSDQFEKGQTYTVCQGDTVLGSVTIADAVSYVNTSASQQDTMGGGQGQMPSGSGSQPSGGMMTVMNGEMVYER